MRPAAARVRLRCGSAATDLCQWVSFELRPNYGVIPGLLRNFWSSGFQISSFFLIHKFLSDFGPSTHGSKSAASVCIGTRRQNAHGGSIVPRCALTTANCADINPAVCVDVFAEVGAVGGLSAVEFGLMRILVIYDAIAVDVAEEQPQRHARQKAGCCPRRRAHPLTVTVTSWRCR